MRSNPPAARQHAFRHFRLVAAALGLVALGVTACDDDTTNSNVAASIAVVSGNTQTGVVGTMVTNPLIVKVTNEDGNPVSGVTVTFASTAGGTIGTPTSTTNSQGQAQSTFVLGPTAGAQTVTATVAGVTTPATFTLTGTAVGGGQQ
ncbi:MAG: Ig-like domain-containing protein [Gemmatimonadota bacterium]